MTTLQLALIARAADYAWFAKVVGMVGMVGKGESPEVAKLSSASVRKGLIHESVKD